jgi:uncharacterized protein (TIGR02421 family)
MESARIGRLIEYLREAEAPVRVLRYLAWPASVREDFFARGANALPAIEYPRFDPGPSLDALRRFRRELGTPDDAVSGWLARQADAIESGARLLASAGTDEFLTHSRALFGTPADVQPDETTSTLGLARQFDGIIESLSHADLGAPPPACHLAAGLADSMRAAVNARFGDAAPDVIVVDELSANALAGPENIRIRRNACFTDRDVDQLIQHEAFVHVLTSLNGRAQPELPILGLSHPGTTRTQEGLAVFAEFITGSMEIDRLRRLADRVIAIQMALDGADFIEVYRWFLARTGHAEQSFENTRRIFRGGRVEGGIPFTKEGVYLDGLLRVHNFMRTAVDLGRADLLRLLFVGKLDIEDIPAIAELRAAGLCRAPDHLPPWAEDPRFLISYLAYSSFLNTIDLTRLRAHYAALADAAPASKGT